MRTVADNLRLLRDFDEYGEVAGWVPVTHRIWDFENLGCVLYIDRGLSVTAEVSDGIGDLDAFTIVGRGFTALINPRLYGWEVIDDGFIYADMRGTTIQYIAPTDSEKVSPVPPEDNLDSRGWNRRPALRLKALAGSRRSELSGDSEVLDLGGGMTVEVFRGESDDHDLPLTAKVNFDDGHVAFEFKGLLCQDDGVIMIEQITSSFVEIRVPGGML